MLRIYKDGQLRDSVSIRITFSKGESPGSWPLKTEYLSQKLPVVKDYELRLTDEATRTYVIDERDGVLLATHQFGNKLYSFFETHDLLLTSSYELRGEDLIFEVTSGKKADGGGEVRSYSMQHLQRAILRRTP